MKLFRSIGRYFRDAGKSVFRNFSLSLASISCITITLIVVALSIILSYNVEKMTEHVSSNTSIVVFLDEEVTDTQIDQVKNNIVKLDNIAEVTFKSRDEWAKETKDKDKTISIVIDSWPEGENHLLDSYEVKVKDINLIDDTASKIEKIANVAYINYGKEYISSVITIFDVIEKVCIGGVVALVLVTAFLIANTIKLAIFSRKTEIEIMRLVGASNMAIKVPFIIEGSFIGFFGSIIPIALISYGYNALYKFLDGRLFSSSLGELVKPYPFILYTSGLLLVIGLLVGMFGSYNAVGFMNKTILIKLSGESLSGQYGHGFDFPYMREVCSRIKEIHDLGCNIAIVCGGGNFMRGRDATEMDRETADYVGMLATVMNSLALKDVFLKLGCGVYNQSGLGVSIIDEIDTNKIKKAFAENKIVIFGGGTGKPFFSTDTGAALRAKDCNADMIIKLTNVDGVYDKDPNKL